MLLAITMTIIVIPTPAFEVSTKPADFFVNDFNLQMYSPAFLKSASRAQNFIVFSGTLTAFSASRGNLQLAGLPLQHQQRVPPLPTAGRGCRAAFRPRPHQAPLVASSLA